MGLRYVDRMYATNRRVYNMAKKEWFDVILTYSEQQSKDPVVLAKVRSKGLASIVCERFREIYKTNCNIMVK